MAAFSNENQVTGHRQPAMTASRPSGLLLNLQHTTPTSCEDRLRYYVHAGIRPRIPLEEQSEQRPRLRALAFDPSLLAAAELRGLARGRCRCRSPFAQLELARIAFHLNRTLLNSFA
jgi:hypothetical protein